MMGFPGTPWGEAPTDSLSAAPANAEWQKRDEVVRHVFTHFELRLDVYTAGILNRESISGEWAKLTYISDYALPTVMKKVLKAVS